MAQNINLEVEGNVLVIRVRLDENLGTSQSGKSEIIATTRGAERAPDPHGDVRINLNVYRPRR